jgi:tripeptidyl-peptidase-1
MRSNNILISIIAIIAIIINTASCSRDPKEWKLVQPARAEQLVTFHVALHQQNTQELENQLYAISDPNSPRYGEELSREQIMEIIAPPKRDHDAVVNWFKAHGNVQIRSYGDALKISAPVHLVEQMLKTRLYSFEHIRNTNYRVIRQVGGLAIPFEISDKIYMITGLTMFPFVPKNRKTVLAEVLGSQNYRAENVQHSSVYPFVSTANIRSLYDIPAGTAATNPNTNQVAVEFLPVGVPAFSDIQQFCQMSNEVYANYSQVIGPVTAGMGALESTLDVELLTGLGTGVANWYFTLESGWIYEMALELFNLKQVPQVVSISYGWPEDDSCDSMVTGTYCDDLTAQQWVVRTNVELLKVALRRVSMLAATADDGAPGPTNIDCWNPSHPVTSIFPAASPYVTSISSTTVIPASNVNWRMKREVTQNTAPICQQGFPCVSGPVVEWPSMATNTFTNWTTGGGFSEMTGMPAYQVFRTTLCRFS